jgi:hypothetical protein
VNHFKYCSQGFHPTNKFKCVKTFIWIHKCTTYYIHIIFIYFTNTLCTTYWIWFITLFYFIVTLTAYVCVNDYECRECMTCHSRTDCMLHGLLEVNSLRMAGSNSRSM